MQARLPLSIPARFRLVATLTMLTFAWVVAWAELAPLNQAQAVRVVIDGDGDKEPIVVGTIASSIAPDSALGDSTLPLNNASVQLNGGYSIAGGVVSMSEQGFIIKSPDFADTFTVPAQNIQVALFPGAKGYTDNKFPDVITLNTAPQESFPCKILLITDAQVDCDTPYCAQVTVPRSAIKSLALGQASTRSAWGKGPLVFDSTWFITGRYPNSEPAGLDAKQKEFLTAATPVVENGHTIHQLNWSLLRGRFLLSKVLNFNPANFSFSVTLTPDPQANATQLTRNTSFSFGDSPFAPRTKDKDTHMQVKITIDKAGISLTREVLYSRRSHDPKLKLATIPWHEVYNTAKDAPAPLHQPITISLTANPTEGAITYTLRVNDRVLASVPDQLIPAGNESAFDIMVWGSIRDMTLTDLALNTTMSTIAPPPNPQQQDLNTQQQYNPLPGNNQAKPPAPPVQRADTLLTTDEEQFTGKLTDYKLSDSSLHFTPQGLPPMQIPLSFVASLGFGLSSTTAPQSVSGSYSISYATAPISLTGELLSLNADSCTLQHRLLGKISIPRSLIRQIKRNSSTNIKRSAP